MVIAAFKSVKEIVKDRRLRIIEKRLEDFYLPLIRYFSHGNLHKDANVHRAVEEIIVSKRHFAVPKVAKVLPPHFTALLGTDDPYFYFGSEQELNTWLTVADAIWDEYVELVKEYYELGGIRDYRALNERPKWMFKLRGKVLI